MRDKIHAQNSLCVQSKNYYYLEEIRKIPERGDY